MAEAIRVALLARPGTACEKLQAALQQAGVDVVHVGDPAAGDTGALIAADPRAILVALEPAVEASLDGFDAILQDPARIVIYDEAELAAQRDGWEAARWSRHLAAKLAGHADVLPPGREAEVGPRVEPRPAWPEMDLVNSETAQAPQAEATEPATRAVTIEYKGGSLVEDPILAPPMDEAPPPSETPWSLESHGVGAAVVLAGIGGPDAVRQFLGAMPERFPRPVLVRQRLDGGRHDRLVRQLQRATPLPVELAITGAPLLAGHVYIVPEGMTTEDGTDGGQRFVKVDGRIGPLAGLPPGDSAVLLLSGADPAQVDEVMDLAGSGTLVAGQSPEECFDNTAPGAAIARGAESGSPSQLAARLARRWTTERTRA